MFSGLLFIVIALLVITLSPEGHAILFTEEPGYAFASAMIVYAVLVFAIYNTCRMATMWIRKHKALCIFLVNILLITYLCFFHYIIAAQRLISIAFVNALFSLSLYFGGLAAYHAGSFYRRYLFPGSDKETRFSYTNQQLRMWLPFVIPFLLFTFIYDILSLFPDNSWVNLLLSPESNPTSIFIFFTFTATILVLLLIFLPYFIQKLWLCEEIGDTDLWLRLVRTCRKANFRCGGLRIWTVMNNFHTAAIIGIIPRFRYVMFTKRLLFEVPIECIEAILVHEIGHCYRRHLMIYPFILFGMFVSASLFSVIFFDSIYQSLQLMDIIYPSIFWSFLLPITILIPYISILALYFRVVFGFYSRLFERQADLHSYVVGTPSRNMIDALDQIGIATGNTHDNPSWHHFSIRERIDFLEKAEKHPEIIEKHHRKVRRWVSIYLVGFVLGCAILFSNFLPEIAPFDTLNTAVIQVSDSLRKTLTLRLAADASEHIIVQNQLFGDDETIKNALTQSLDSYAEYYDEGIVEYASAEQLFRNGQMPASIQLTTIFWQKIPANKLTVIGLKESKEFTENLLEISSDDPQLAPLRRNLEKSYNEALSKINGDR